MARQFINPLTSNCAIYLNYNIVPLIRRGKGCYFWLDPKVTKRSSQQRGFFAARALYAANQVKPGAAKIAPPHLAYASQMLYAPAATQPTTFYLISPEAFLLTAMLNKGIYIK